MTGMNRIV